MKRVWVTLTSTGGAYITEHRHKCSVRYVQASELDGLRRALKAKQAEVLQLQADIQKTNRQWLKECRENRRLRKAIEWVLSKENNANKCDVASYELARRAGLRWDGKKWRKG